MKQYERDYFVSRIRSGYANLKHKGVKLKVVTPTIDEVVESNDIFIQSYTKSQMDGIKTQDEMLDWMMESGLWTEEDNEKEEGLEKDIETLKKEMFNHRNQEGPRERIRQYIRAAEKQLNTHLISKTKFYDSTCEGVSFLDKNLYLFKRTTFLGSYNYDFSSVAPKDVWMAYQGSFCTEKTIRELARSEPWGSLWVMKDVNEIQLFHNKDGRELSLEQRSLLSWSTMYDNINEAYESPSRDVIEDDDVLDGWLLLQSEKRKSERAKSELEHTMNDKVKNSDEIFMMAGSKKDAERIDSLNSVGSKMVKKERKAHIKRAGKLDQHQLPDQKIQIQNQLNQQYKDKFRR